MIVVCVESAGRTVQPSPDLLQGRPAPRRPARSFTGTQSLGPCNLPRCLGIYLYKTNWDVHHNSVEVVVDDNLIRAGDGASMPPDSLALVGGGAGADLA